MCILVGVFRVLMKLYAVEGSLGQSPNWWMSLAGSVLKIEGYHHYINYVQLLLFIVLVHDLDHMEMCLTKTINGGRAV